MGLHHPKTHTDGESRIVKSTIRKIRAFFRRIRIRWAYRLLRSNGFVVMRQHQLVAAVMECQMTERKLTKMSGGNLSKLRDPRKSMRRLISRFRKNLQALDQEYPS